VVRVLKDQKLRSGIERLANWILEEDRQQGGRGRVVLAHVISDREALRRRARPAPLIDG
jgi:CRP/FNR family transcriptional activator FtrB